MKACHVSFGLIKVDDVEHWLRSVPYFTRILSAMAEQHEVTSFHYNRVEKLIESGNVRYRFLRQAAGETFSCSRLVREVNLLQPDVIILHGFHASWRTWIFTNRLSNFRIYVQHHSEKLFGPLKSMVQRKIDRHVQGYFFASRPMAEEWVRAGLIENSRKIYETFEATSSFPVKDSAQARTNPLSFIWVGRLDENKDPLTLLDGFIRFLNDQPSAILYILFKTDELLADVKERTSRFSNNIQLVGNVPHGEMPFWYAKANFIISSSRYEVGAVAVLEAMSAGCIPILTRIPAFEKISSNGSVGMLYPINAPGMLARALLEASQMDLARERERVKTHFEENLSASAIASRMVAAFEIERSSP